MFVKCKCGVHTNMMMSPVCVGAMATFGQVNADAILEAGACELSHNVETMSWLAFVEWGLMNFCQSIMLYVYKVYYVFDSLNYKSKCYKLFDSIRW